MADSRKRAEATSVDRNWTKNPRTELRMARSVVLQFNGPAHGWSRMISTRLNRKREPNSGRRDQGRGCLRHAQGVARRL